jgi:hypothetical protein
MSVCKLLCIQEPASNTDHASAKHQKGGKLPPPRRRAGGSLNNTAMSESLDPLKMAGRCTPKETSESLLLSSSLIHQASVSMIMGGQMGGMHHGGNSNLSDANFGANAQTTSQFGGSVVRKFARDESVVGERDAVRMSTSSSRSNGVHGGQLTTSTLVLNSAVGATHAGGVHAGGAGHVGGVFVSGGDGKNRSIQHRGSGGDRDRDASHANVGSGGGGDDDDDDLRRGRSSGSVPVSPEAAECVRAIEMMQEYLDKGKNDGVFDVYVCVCMCCE